MNQIEKIRKCIRESGFEDICIDLRNYYVYEKYENHKHYVIVVADCTKENNIKREEYEYVVAKLKGINENKQDELCFMSFICTDNLKKTDKFGKNDRNQWIINILNGNIIIYENQISDFYGFKDKIENLYVKKSIKDVVTKGQNQLGICNMAIIIINILVFIIVELTGSYEDTEHMLRCGAMYGPLVIKENEYYRLITHMFLHFGIAHLLNNMIVLAFMGQHLERAIGKMHYIFIYFGSGIIAGIASMGYNMLCGTEVVSAGASGAIFGIVGAMVYIVAVNKGRLEDLSSRQLILFVILSIYAGMTSEHTDNAAHIGGFIGGVLIAIILYRKPVKRHG